MGLTVRSAEGELRFKDRRELQRAIDVGLVDTGEVHEDGEAEWNPLPTRRRRWFSHWYVLAALLLIAGILRAGFVVCALDATHP